MNKKIIGTAVIALGIGFSGGYFLHTPPAPTTGGTATRTFGGGMRGGAGGGFLSGTVAARCRERDTQHPRR